MHTGMRRLYFYTMYVHLYIYTVPVTQLYLKFALERDNVVYWKTKRKIKNDLQFALIGIAFRHEGGDSK